MGVESKMKWEAVLLRDSGHRLGTMQLSIGSARKVGGLLIDASPNYICTPTFKPSFKRMARFAEFASGNQLQ